MSHLFRLVLFFGELKISVFQAKAMPNEGKMRTQKTQLIDKS